jgi:hypothetical protein
MARDRAHVWNEEHHERNVIFYSIHVEAFLQTFDLCVACWEVMSMRKL